MSTQAFQFPVLLLRGMICFALFLLNGCDITPKNNLLAPSTIIDGRFLDAPNPDTSWLSHPAIVLAASQARTYWQEYNPDFAENFLLMDTATGSFTATEIQQTAVLYLISLWPRCCSNMGLALLENNHLVLNLVFEGGRQQLISAGDLDNDRYDELVLVGSFGMGGSNETSMQIVSLADTHITILASHSLISDNCSTLREDSQLIAWRVTLNTTLAPRIQSEQFATSCETAEWNSTGVTEEQPFPANQKAVGESDFTILSLQQ